LQSWCATQDSALLKDTYDFALDQYHVFISSLGGLIGGSVIEPDNTISYPEIDEQRNAIRYAFGEGAQSLDVFLQPDLVARTSPAGALRRISQARARIVTTFLNARRLASIEEQASLRRANYSLFDYANDVTEAIWGDRSSAISSMPTCNRWKACSGRSMLPRRSRQKISLRPRVFLKTMPYSQ
jgi:hypothetical protein